MIDSGSAITLAIMVISLASGTTQAFKCMYCVDSPATPHSECKADTFDPTSTSVSIQNPTTAVFTPLNAGNILFLTSSDYDCSTACAVYTSASRSLTIRSCYIKTDITTVIPDIKMQNCHTDYCNTAPMFPDTPPSDAPSSLQCYACFNSVPFGSSVVGCDDSNFQSAQIPIQPYSTNIIIGEVIIPPAYFDCSACQIIKIKSSGLTLRSCSTSYNLNSLGDVQSQTCHSNRCNGYPLIADSSATSSFQLGFFMRIGFVLAAVLSMIFLS